MQVEKLGICVKYQIIKIIIIGSITLCWVLYIFHYLVTNGLYYNHCYALSIVVVTAIRFTSICSVPYNHN
jgi:hypothetical protein